MADEQDKNQKTSTLPPTKVAQERAQENDIGSMGFTWKKFFTAFADRLLALGYADNAQKRKDELIPKLKAACNDTGISFPFDKISDIDPFSIYSLFNGGVRDDAKRLMIIKELNKSFPKSSDPTPVNIVDEKDLPSDFVGLQVIETGGGGLSSYFVSYSFYRNNKPIKDEETKIAKLWDLFAKAVTYARSPDDDGKEKFKTSYKEAKNLFDFWRITAGLFWIAPDFFVPLDSHSRGYIDFLSSIGFFPSDIKDNVTTALGRRLPDADGYMTIRDGLCESFKEQNRVVASFCEFSDNAFRFSRIAEMKSLLEANGQIILHGAPGTGKTYTARELAFVVTRTDFQKKDNPQIKFVQFHPGYDYSDFIVGLKPILVDGTNGMKQVSFEWKSGILKQLAEAARGALDFYAQNDYPTMGGDAEFDPQKFVLLIDEINRADLSNVFGEVFSCMEYRYRYKRQDKELDKLERQDGNPTFAIDENAVEITLPSIKTDVIGNEVRDKDGKLVHETLVIPENLYIIGTMNDIDRSVESIDFALRRRFAWKEIDAADSKRILEAKTRKGVFDESVKNRLEKAMDDLNFEICGEAEEHKEPKLRLRLGKPYELGGAIFAKLELYVEGDGERKKYPDAAFKSLWENHIAVILREYLRGQDNPESNLRELKKMYEQAVGISDAEQKKPRIKKNQKGEQTQDLEQPPISDPDADVD